MQCGRAKQVMNWSQRQWNREKQDRWTFCGKWSWQRSRCGQVIVVGRSFRHFQWEPHSVVWQVDCLVFLRKLQQRQAWWHYSAEWRTVRSHPCWSHLNYLDFQGQRIIWSPFRSVMPCQDITVCIKTRRSFIQNIRQDISIKRHIKKKWYYTIETYLLTYGMIRFVLENLRYDAVRGSMMGISTSQWISLIMIILSIGSVCRRKIRKLKGE